MKAGSYTSSTGLVNQVAFAWRTWVGKCATHCDDALSGIRQVETRLLEAFGVRLTNLEVLEAGPGQFMGQTMYLALRNRVTAIDRDVIVYKSGVGRYLTMTRVNGLQRTVKAIGRKTLGLDRQYLKRWKDVLGVSTLPDITIRQMDIYDMAFTGGIFDFVYSRALFHHLPNPALALNEMNRVLKPAGIGYITIHPWTSPTGCLDRRVFHGQTGQLGTWPHLRKETVDLIRPNGTLNKLTLAQWRELAATLPDSQVLITPSGWKYAELAHQVPGYSVEELTAGEIAIMWRKPQERPIR